MPRNDQIRKILLIGSGPIIIGQGCEFDYSGVQACKALREEGYQVVLVNSNPATIMTDPEFADRTYIEPITPAAIEAILEREKPDAILPTMGGQTALNAAMELNRNGALVRHNVQLIGANALAIAKGEDRQLFKEAMVRIGLDVARSGIARSLADAERVAAEIGSFPLIIRPAFTLGGSGGGIAYNREELETIVELGLDLSPVSEVLIEESLLGWKEFEMEVMRDRADNCVVVCSIENLDPMGVHTGDSITVAPAQTLTDREYQAMRDASFAVIREIGVETGGSNIQFAIHPDNGRMVVIEMNPRVSRSSALASKATGFPIAKIAAKLAVGYTLDEIRNDITRETPASFEPTIDYCVVKIPRFTFEKFPEADATLTTRMKSVGEAMAIGRTFKEALQKALRSLEIKRFGLCGDGRETRVDPETLRRKLSVPNAERIFYLAQSLQDGMSIEEIFRLTKIDRWFLSNLAQIVEAARTLQAGSLRDGSGWKPELRGVTKPTRQSSTEPSAQSATQSAAQLPMQPAARPVTQSATDSRVHPPTPSVAQTSTQSAAQSSTSATAQSRVHRPAHSVAQTDAQSTAPAATHLPVPPATQSPALTTAPSAAQSGAPSATGPAAGGATQPRNSGFQPDPSRRLPACSFLFHPFDPRGEVDQRRRNLPHREQPGATYFVTFRLGDSVPHLLLQEWREEQQAWRKHNPPPWDWKTEQEYRRRFVESREDWLDRGHGSCLLRESQAARIVADALRHFHGERYALDRFVVMPNHVHALVQPLGENALSTILHSWKSFTANELNRLLDRTGDIWMTESYDHAVRDAEELAALREYIAANPEKAGLKENEFILQWEETLAVAPNAQAGSPLDEAGTMPELRPFKRLGFSDRQLAHSLGRSEDEIRSTRLTAGVVPTYRLVDTCAAEFEAYTPYYYSTYGDENEVRPNDKRKIMILGGGPNRIGQGIEFDYCCVHAAFALRELGIETIMVNSNPETVSTDYDTSDRLYFEPLTHEDVLNIYEQEKPEGVIVQFGGQTPLNLAAGLKAAGVPIIGTAPESIERAEDRKLFAEMLDRLGLRQSPSGSATSEEEAIAIAERVGYPVLVRPSFVLGGRGMQIVYNEADLRNTGILPVASSGHLARSDQAGSLPDPSGWKPELRPVLIDRFLEDAIEVDVDCIADGKIAVIGAIMEHIEEAGIHSGDSACVIPTFSLSSSILAEITRATKAMAMELKVRGLMNVQFAVKDDKLYVLEVNPRASRTVPFVSKAIGVPLAKLAAQVMTGKSLGELGFTREIVPAHYSVKEAVFPFLRFEGINISLGPEMKSTGEVMGIDADLGLAFAKSQIASQWPLPTAGKVFISVKDIDKPNVVDVAREYANLGFGIVSTSGTAEYLTAAGLAVTKVFKVAEGRPNVLDLVKNGEIQFIINTPSGKTPRQDEVKIRTAALTQRIPIMTTVRAAAASAMGIRSLQQGAMTVKSLQEYHAQKNG